MGSDAERRSPRRRSSRGRLGRRGRDATAPLGWRSSEPDLERGDRGGPTHGRHRTRRPSSRRLRRRDGRPGSMTRPRGHSASRSRICRRSSGMPLSPSAATGPARGSCGRSGKTRHASIPQVVPPTPGPARLAEARVRYAIPFSSRTPPAFPDRRSPRRGGDNSLATR